MIRLQSFYKPLRRMLFNWHRRRNPRMHRDHRLGIKLYERRGSLDAEDA